jgi:hypothetical protein
MAVVSVIIGMRVIAAAMITMAPEPRPYAHTDRAKLHAHTAGIRAQKDLRAGRSGQAECGNRSHNEQKLLHNALQILFDSTLHL